ncbi:1,3-beta-glucanosyltransferase Gas4p [Monosporozyma unispora]|nr:Glycolipid anchored surface protein 4 precursor [Kazachstania unispora]
MTIYTKVILNLLLLSLKLVATSELESKPGISSIEVKGKQFINSQTGEPFLIKGLAYQPGGSADVNEDQDPLSEPTICSRDIPLFQQLGVNTIRVYSINPDLNHDYCMSLLAMAGIYLILDVNSPLPNQHLNRYEPWKSYNPFYMEHVFKVVKQFSNYSNTLAFFAGNEVVNDFKSSQLSPRYVKQLIGDIKMFSDKHCPRTIPIGYSAADDLNYRVSLSNYLACYNDSTPMQIVDFYGVNSYQWCGQQTLKTSGYDLLIDAYKDYSRPVILSEFGCNKVLPRKFGEIEGIFSQEMLKVFSGGLAYEYSQESNNYGLVEILDEGDIKLLSDFHELKNQYCSIDLANVKVEISKDDMGDVPCVDQYKNLNVNMEIAEELSKDLIEDGVEVEVGKHIAINLNKIHINEAIYNADGTPWKDNTGLKVVYDLFPQTKEKTVSKHDEKGKERKETTDSKKKNTATSIKCLSIYDWVVIISAITLLVITMF